MTSESDDGHGFCGDGSGFCDDGRVFVSQSLPDYWIIADFLGEQHK